MRRSASGPVTADETGSAASRAMVTVTSAARAGHALHTLTDRGRALLIESMRHYGVAPGSATSARLSPVDAGTIPAAG